MIDNLFNAALALSLLVGTALTVGAALQDSAPGARTAQNRPPAQLVATAQTDTMRSPLR